MTPDNASFRDPAGFVFTQDGVVLRQVNLIYSEHYDLLMQSGLYADLVGAGLLIPHREYGTAPSAPAQTYKVIEPDKIPFISYPSEWSSGQLKQAALTTLEVQRRALSFGMSLKDASSFNIQFIGSRAVLIDTLSLERYVEGTPWVAYRQFCEHFLAPLALMSLANSSAAALLGNSIDGIPLTLASRLLPIRSRLRPSLLLHLHFHTLELRKHQNPSASRKTGHVTLTGLRGLIDSLHGAVSRLKFAAADSEWDDYYDRTNYPAAAMEEKASIVRAWVEELKPKIVWDIGSNRGRFSRIAAESGCYVISADSDPAAVDSNYRQCQLRNETNILPVVIDISNPTPAFGWANTERRSFLQRGPADTILALALVHHLVITRGVPFEKIAATLAGSSTSLIVEFPSVEDSQVRQMLSQNTAAVARYSETAFRDGFGRHFRIVREQTISGSHRTLFLMTPVAS
ncbi:hypothetical protein [Tardiphaga sp.]|uniref:hypothetical protein n=1 Tax=Tardiphaga sp. TaxID=1926292 RepID=UPI002619AF4D|nr:hypothetical protein [Tardiphaga sp.]MDB5619751.1 hypothetical protein [Tardiphaga sp.]